MTKRAALVLVAIAVMVTVLVVGVLGSGIRFYSVMTPSMGTTAPVGTLVVTRPAASYGVGQIITYERTGRSYTHRITEASPDGTFITKGDLNSAADPLAVTKAQIVGEAVWIAPGLGWLWRGLPWLALGFLLVYALSVFRRLDRSWRWALRISGCTLVLCLVAVWLRPWVSLDQLGWSPSSAGGVDMHVVNTGLFPLDALGHRLVSGQDAIVNVTAQNDRGEYTLTPTLAFYWWEQVGLLLLCLIPLGLSLLIKDERAEPARAIQDPPDEAAEDETEGLDSLLSGEDVAEGAGAEAAALAAGAGDQSGPNPSIQAQEGVARSESSTPDRDWRRLALIGAIVLAVIIGVAVVTLTTTHSALSAAVLNNRNTAGVRATCRGAVTNLGSANTVFAYAMEPTGPTRTETDISGNNYAGTYLQTPASYTTSPLGCTQDKPLSAVAFNGTSQCLYSAAPSQTNVQTFSVEAWFRTTRALANGKIIGFGASRNSVTETTYDRHVYIDNLGRVIFGTYNGGFDTIASAAGYNDGNWHNVIATFSTATGMTLYLDGARVAVNTGYTVAENTTGFWKVGCGNLADWPNGAGGAYTGPSYFTGTIQYAAVYRTVLSAAAVAAHYQAGRP